MHVVLVLLKQMLRTKLHTVSNMYAVYIIYSMQIQEKERGILNICMQQTNGGDRGMRATDPFQRAGGEGWFGG
jgi:hypothetical protein